MNDGAPVSTHCCPARLSIGYFRCRFKHTNQVRGGEFLLRCGVVARPTRQHHEQTLTAQPNQLEPSKDGVIEPRSERDAKLEEIEEGTSDIQRLVISRGVLNG